MERPKPKKECLFRNKLGIKPDPNPCSGRMTKHHVLYKCEGGTFTPTIGMCEGHQRFVHRKNSWGGENFDQLIPKTIFDSKANGKQNGKH
jgi:hypothetical protein